MEEIVTWPDTGDKGRLEILQAIGRRRRDGFRTVASKRRLADGA